MSKELFVELRERIVRRHRSGNGIKQFLECWKFPRAQWAPSLGNGKNMELSRLFLEMAFQPNWATGQEGPWSSQWARTQWPLWQKSRVPWLRWENLTEVQQSLQHFTNLGFMWEWPDGSHDWEKGTWKHAWSLQNSTWKTLRAWGKRFCGYWYQGTSAKSPIPRSLLFLFLGFLGFLANKGA